MKEALDSGQITDKTASFFPFKPPLAETTEDRAKALTDVLRLWPDVSQQFANGTFLMLGNHPTSLSIDMLAKWLLARTRNVGPDEAVANLIRFLSTNTLEGTEKLIVTGLRVVGNGVTLGHGIILTMVDHRVMDSPQLARIYNYVVNGYMTDTAEILPLAALQCRVEHKKSFFRMDGRSGPESDLYQSRAHDLDEARRFLTVITDHVRPVALGSWWQPDDWVPQAESWGWISRPRAIDQPLGGGSFLHKEYLDAAVRLYDAFYRFAPEDRERLLMVLDRLNTARRAASQTDQAAELGIAAEYLFMYEPERRSRSSEIRHKLSLRAAWFLEPLPAERSKVFKLFKNIYDCRSDIVHDGKFTKETEKVKDETLSLGPQLIVNAVRKIIERGSFPPWESLVLGQTPGTGFSSTV